MMDRYDAFYTKYRSVHKYARWDPKTHNFIKPFTISELTEVAISGYYDDKPDDHFWQLATYRRNKVNTIEQLKGLISEGADINARDDYGITTLMYAAASDTPIEVLRFLIENGAKVYDKDFFGDTVLMHSVGLYSSSEEIQLLIEHGADINARNNEGKTALMYAVEDKDLWIWESSFPIISALIKYGAEINARDNDGKTALMFTYANEPAEYLIDKGIDINAKDNNGNTVLMHWALIEDSYLWPIESRLSFLVEKGVDIYAKNNNGETALMLAIKAGINASVEALLKYYPDVVGSELTFSLMKAAVESDNPEMLNKFFSKNDSNKVINEDGDNLFMYAVKLGKVNSINKLMDHADLNAINKNGKTALDYAVESGNREIANKLLEKGAEIDALTKDNLKTVMDWLDHDPSQIAQSIEQHSEVSHRVYQFDFLNWLKSLTSETIILNHFGIYYGGYGRDDFVVSNEYDGKQNGFKLVIGDFNYQGIKDTLDLTQNLHVQSIDDLRFSEITFDGARSLKIKDSNDDTLVILKGKTIADVGNIDFILVSSEFMDLPL